MKKLLLSILAIAAITACSKSEVEYDAPAEIGISPVTQNRTKAMVSGTEFPEDENFMVWAWYKALPKATSISFWQESDEAQQTYIDEKVFVPKTGDDKGLWGGSNAYYWPKMGSLMFAGYYPATEAMQDLVSYEFTSDVNKMTVAGFTPGDYQTTGFVDNAENAKHEEDFMYFNMTATSCDASTTGPDNSVKDGNHVDVVFKHALSWLTVVLKKDDSTPDDATITVKKVYFSDVNTKGTGTVNNSPDTENGESNVIDWETTTEEDDITDVYVLGSSDTDNETALTTDYTCKEPVIIPQTMDGNIVVVYEIKSKDGSAFTETVSLPLSGLSNGVTSWDPAKHYTYTVTIGTTEILIDPYVADWEVVKPVVNAK